jgi:DNA replication protein DnaC
MELNEFETLLGLDNIKKTYNDRALMERKKNGIGCVLCNYTGYILNQDEKNEMCSCEKDKYLREIFIKNNVPLIYLNKSLEDWNTRTDALGNDLGIQQSISQNIYSLLNFYEKKMTNICSGRLPKVKHSSTKRENLQSIIFEGGIGSGKTFIASVMVQSAIRKNLNAKYYDWSELIETFIDFDKKSKADDIIEEFKFMDLICIDGIEYLNFNHPQLPYHIDRMAKARLNSGKPTLLFASFNHTQIQTGSGWQSLLRNCLQIRLPNAIR